MRKKIFTFLLALAASVGMSWAASNDKLPGAFSVSPTKVVYFSKGNLQATTNDLGTTWTWGFAEHQWDYIGGRKYEEDSDPQTGNNFINGNGTVSENGTVDLFGWSTTATYYGIHYITSDASLYPNNFVDWGNAMGGDWYTLSSAEWTYLFSGRANAANLRGQAKVNGKNGYIFLPDDWTIPSGLEFNPNPGLYYFNTYSGDNWTAMENAGAVFLPASGYRYGTEVSSLDNNGYYWSSTFVSSPYYPKAGRFYFNENKGQVTDDTSWSGQAVRLVSGTPPSSGPTYLDANFGINFRTNPYTKVGGGSLPDGVEVTGDFNDNQHGYYSPVITIPVTAGNYKVTMGTCQYSNQDGSVKNEDGSVTYATLATNTGVCYDADPANNIVSAIFNVPTDQIIKVYGAQYTPYFAIEQLDADKYYINFANKTEGVEGTVPAQMVIDEGTMLTLPANRTLYKAGYTLTGWTDGVNTYAPEEYVTPASHLVLTAVFTANATTIADATEEVSVRWYFGEGNGAPSMWLEGSNGFIIAQATVGGNPIDVRLDIDGTAGKFYNKDMYNQWAQVLANTTFTFPAKDGAIVSALGAYTSPANYSVSGNVLTANDAENYYSYLDVIYPASTPTPANPSGSCGENLTWEFNTETGALTISGTGAMTSAPWGTYKEDITSLSLPDGLTAIPSEAFQGCTGLTTVTIPASVTSIGADAFCGCESVTDVYCYPKAADLNWNDYYKDDFIEDHMVTRCHVYADEFDGYMDKYADADGVNVTFMNDLEAVAVTTNKDPQNPAVYYSTFYHGTQKYRLPNDGTEAYVADLSGSDLRLTKIAEGNKVLPNGVAVILKAPGINVTLFPTEAEPVTFTAHNSLQGVDAETTAPENTYVLSGTEQHGVGFYLINSATLKAHKAYVVYNGSQTNAPARMRFVFNEEKVATSVDQVPSDQVQSTKELRDGQLVIIKNGVKYNAQGQIVK